MCEISSSRLPISAYQNASKANALFKNPLSLHCNTNRILEIYLITKMLSNLDNLASMPRFVGNFAFEDYFVVEI